MARKPPTFHLGWEEWSDLYIVDLQNGHQEVLVSYNSENKPKDVIWEDGEHVLVIIGFPHGTVNRGGGLYRINVETYEREQIPIPGHNNEAADFAGVESVGNHTLRRTFGYWFYKATKDIAMLQGISNHSHPSITLIYIGITEEETNNVLKSFSVFN